MERGAKYSTSYAIARREGRSTRWVWRTQEWPFPQVRYVVVIFGGILSGEQNYMLETLRKVKKLI